MPLVKSDPRRDARAALERLREAAVGLQRADQALESARSAFQAGIALLEKYEAKGAGLGGRPSLRRRPEVVERFAQVEADLRDGRLSLRQAGQRVGVSATTIVRMLKGVAERQQE